MNVQYTRPEPGVRRTCGLSASKAKTNHQNGHWPALLFYYSYSVPTIFHLFVFFNDLSTVEY